MNKKISLSTSQIREYFLCQTLFDYAAEAIFVTSVEGNILDCNQAAILQTGYSSAEMKRMNIRDIHVFPEKETTQDNELNWSELQHGEIRNLRTYLQRKDQSVFPVEVHIIVVEREGKRLICFQVRDVSVEVAATEKLISSEDLFRKLTETSPMAIMMYQDNMWVYSNTAGCEISGYTEKELLQMHFFDFVHPDYRPMIIDKGKKRQSGAANDPDRYEFPIITKQGVVKWVYLSGTVVSYQGRPAGLVSVIDITERKEAELLLQDSNLAIARQNEEYIATNEELNQTLEILKQTNLELGKAKIQAEESDRLKSAFLANMSHEIRTPMNAILGFSRLLGKENLTREQQNLYVAQIQNSGDQLLRIINDIIDISKIEANILKVELAPVDIHEILYAITDKENNPYGHPFKPDVEVKCAISSREPAYYIETDKIRLTQILNNLMNNAAKFTSQGVIEAGYKIVHRNNREYVVFFVSDTGTGIRPEYQDKIFNRFIQGGMDNFSEGNGLGLAIVKGLVDLLGGSISLVSAPGKGSTFSVSVPNTGMIPEGGGQPADPEEYIGFFENKRVYVAEDDSNSACLIHEMLADTGIIIQHVIHGKELMELLEKELPDAVILDINMPVMNGYETIAAIRRRYPHLPVIAQTAYAMPDEKAGILAAGCNEYISKPLDMEELLRTIKKVLR
ncbi:MAG: PAS domain S-box protein [Bacteroidales bacterium]